MTMDKGSCSSSNNITAASTSSTSSDGLRTQRQGTVIRSQDRMTTTTTTTRNTTTRRKRSQQQQQQPTTTAATAAATTTTPIIGARTAQQRRRGKKLGQIGGTGGSWLSNLVSRLFVLDSTTTTSRTTKTRPKQRRTKRGNNKNDHNNNDDDDNGGGKWWWAFTGLGLDRTTWQGTLVLMVAMAGSLVWNNYQPWSSFLTTTTRTTAQQQEQQHQSMGMMVDPHVDQLIQMAQQGTSSSSSSSLFYHSHVQTIRDRTQTAMEVIPAQTTILRIPRHELIMDIDALRNDYIQREFFMSSSSNQNEDDEKSNMRPPRRKDTGQPLTADVYLAVHLARLLQQQQQNQNHNQQQDSRQGTTTTTRNDDNNNKYHKNKDNNKDKSDVEDDVNGDIHNKEVWNLSAFLQQYLMALPNQNDYRSFHPIYWWWDIPSSPPPPPRSFSLDEKNHQHHNNKKDSEMMTSATAPSATSLLWQQRLRTSSISTFDFVTSYRETLMESYHALCRVSPRFANEISQNDFTTSLLHVWTRSFGTGPLPPSFSTNNNNNKEEEQEKKKNNPDEDVNSPTLLISQDEIEWYQQNGGIDLSKGCHCMVPILDLYNHYAKPNVEFSFDWQNKQGGGFVVSTLMIGHSTGSVTGSSISRGQDIWDSYGKHSEAHLFAKYGFVNDDGSDYTQASLALFHPVYSQGLASLEQDDDDNDNDEQRRRRRIQAQRLLKYLHYDDGYQDCIRPPTTTRTRTTTTTTSSSKDDEDDIAAWEFKILKLQHLMQIAQDPQRWMIFLAPRNLQGRPPHSLYENDDVGDGSATTQTQEKQMDKKKNKKKKKIPHFVPSKVQLDANPIMGTCRLLSMTHRDYNNTNDDETATDMLRNHLMVSTSSWTSSASSFSSFSSSSSFIPPPTKNDALQYRELMCILRLSKMAMQLYNTTVDEQVQVVRSLNDKRDLNRAKQQEDQQQQVKEEEEEERNWKLAHIKLAELQALQVLRENVMQWMDQFLRQYNNNDNKDYHHNNNPSDLLNTAPEYTLQNVPCPWNDQMALLEYI